MIIIDIVRLLLSIALFAALIAFAPVLIILVGIVLGPFLLIAYLA